MCEKISAGHKFRSLAFLVAAMIITGCSEDGGFSFPGTSKTATNETAAQPAAAQGRSVEQDVERPDIFAITDRGLWDGRPSLGGIWVAHPDVTDPERVRITNQTNGQTVIGALFRRERENPGPLLQMSSDAADALGILAGAPTEISVVVLRRQEVLTAPTPEENPVVAALAAPVSVQETALDPVDASAVNPEATGAVIVAAQPPDTTAAGAPDLAGRLIQIGVFSIQANAEAAAGRLRAAGLAAQSLPEEAGGRTVWRVVSGPATDADAQAAMLAQIKQLGFADAFGFEI
ncbi:MAG: SPOR domain-containing protein [Yoonia sp.]|nr:SPOR domain-containing protein [Yoonia sp.]